MLARWRNPPGPGDADFIEARAGLGEDDLLAAGRPADDDLFPRIPPVAAAAPPGPNELGLLGLLLPTGEAWGVANDARVPLMVPWGILWEVGAGGGVRALDADGGGVLDLIWVVFVVDLLVCGVAEVEDPDCEDSFAILQSYLLTGSESKS